MKKVLAFSLSAVTLVIPVIALAQVETTLKGLAYQIVKILNVATATLVAAAFVAFMFGAAYNLIKAGERGSAALREFLVWGVITLFVMVSIWGILALLQNTLFGYNGRLQSASEVGGGNGAINF